MKNIETLIPDIHNLFENDVKVDHAILDEMLAGIKSAVVEALEEKAGKRDLLRLSKSGTPDRKLWFENKYHKMDIDDSDPGTGLSGENLFRFLIGHVTEALLIYLAKQAGHSVEFEQELVEVEGVPGHIDCVIDGHLVDIKTASQFAFDKFRNGSILDGNDPFGYVAQLSSYRHAMSQRTKLKDESYFWAYNKSNSEQVLTKVFKTDLIDAEKRIKRQKEILTLEEPPLDKCYPDEEFGKSGNRVLGKNCLYCPFKFECWQNANGGKGLRAFEYAKGPVYFTKVEREPNQKEL